MKEKVSDKGAPPAAAPSDPPQALAPLDFSTFVLSLGSAAMVHLGRVPRDSEASPAGGSADLPAAKQVLDILAIIEEKTRGNLDESEDKLIKSLLYDLRVAYVDAQKKP